MNLFELHESSNEYDRALFKFRVAETANSIDDALLLAKKVCDLAPKPLCCGDINVLNVAYKKLVGRSRKVLMKVADMRSKFKESPLNVAILDEFHRKEFAILQRNCEGLFEFLAELPKCNESDGSDEPRPDWREERGNKVYRAYILKTIADHNRYLAENAEESDGRDKFSAAAREHYERAKNTLSQGPNSVPCIHPLSIGIDLNYSVLLHDVLNLTDEALRYANDSVEKALDKLEAQDEIDFVDTTLTLQLFRENITFWKSST